MAPLLIWITSFAATLLLCSCTIREEASPIPGVRDAGTELCIVDKEDVRTEFKEEMLRAIEARGITPRVIAAGSGVDTCPWVLTYNAKWSWDFVTYMAWAEMKVYRDGKWEGQAVYDAPRAGWSMNVRIYESTRTKVNTMVDGLFP